jgi:GxxExxY protein
LEFDQQTKDRSNELSRQVIGAAIEVHRHLGPGLLESTYEACLCRELELRGVPYQRQVPLTLSYKGLEVECAYRMDVIVGGLLIVELKSVKEMDPIYEAQLLTHLRLYQRWLGLLSNFNAAVLKEGIKRLVI